MQPGEKYQKKWREQNRSTTRESTTGEMERGLLECSSSSNLPYSSEKIGRCDWMVDDEHKGSEREI
ncbi:unnamed protein product [Ilex paraguariensis]|uniref:Uncharacterized protein n=1 Tax=Ilex paraguariensis TaxID=185542 RepID=A0ABC8TQI2_9AQUA